MRRVACVWFPRWPLQRLVNARPELKGQAVIVYEPNRGLRVVDCSRVVAEQGVRRGMPLAEAYALVAPSPEKIPQHSRPETAAGNALHCVLYDPSQDRENLEQLASRCEHFSPIVGLETGPAPGSLLLDITGCQRYFRGETTLAREIETTCQQWGYHAVVAIADTVGAAWALAHYARCRSTGEALIAPPGQSADWLAPLPIASLRLEPGPVELLRQLGVMSVGQLAQLPRDGLTSRFGSELLSRMRQAFGEVPEVVVPHRETPSPSESWEFDTPTGRLPVVEKVLAGLLEKLLPRFPLGHGARQMTVVLRGAERQQCDVSMEVFSPTALLERWQELLRLRLESVRLEWPVSTISLQASGLAPLEARQEELFTGTTRDRPEELADLLNRLSNRLGRNAVLRPRMVADAQPEFACKYTPVLGEGKQTVPVSKPRKKSTAKGPEIPGGADNRLASRPLRLAATPIPLPVACVVPQGFPVRFQWDNREHRVAHYWGPERIETGWWRGQRIARDYYRVETTTGHRYWLFRCRQDGQWFLQGWFE